MEFWLLWARSGGWGEYKNKQAANRLAVFTEGYDNAKDTEAFVKEFDFAKKSGSVSFSTSSASEGDQDCESMLRDLDGVKMMAQAAIDHHTNNNIPDTDRDWIRMFDIFVAEITALDEKLERNGCLDGFAN